MYCAILFSMHYLMYIPDDYKFVLRRLVLSSVFSVPARPSNHPQEDSDFSSLGLRSLTITHFIFLLVSLVHGIGANELTRQILYLLIACGAFGTLLSEIFYDSSWMTSVISPILMYAWFNSFFVVHCYYKIIVDSCPNWTLLANCVFSCISLLYVAKITIDKKWIQ